MGAFRRRNVEVEAWERLRYRNKSVWAIDLVKLYCLQSRDLMKKESKALLQLHHVCLTLCRKVFIAFS